MSGAQDITPLVLTFNERANIRRTLSALTWASRVVVIDSFSDDGTVEICRTFPNVVVVQRRFDGHTPQWNFGLQQVESEWVLSLDADYALSEDLVSELIAWQPSPGVDGYFADFTYCVFGSPLRASLYPPRLVLFRRARGAYVVDGHTQRLRLDGAAGHLHGRIRHDDRKPLDRWFADQLRYSAQEAAHLAETPATALSRLDRLRKRIVAPILVIPYAFVCKGLLFDGRAGWYYVMQRAVAEFLLALRVLDDLFRKDAADGD